MIPVRAAWTKAGMRRRIRLMVGPNTPPSSEVLAVGREHGWHAVNLRPVLVYGPGMKGNLARLIAAALARLVAAAAGNR